MPLFHSRWRYIICGEGGTHLASDTPICMCPGLLSVGNLFTKPVKSRINLCLIVGCQLGCMGIGG